jgi:glycosyltransferase involved in cell wall biosynthesis
VKIGIVTDAWRPQTNGVVTTLARTTDCLRAFGHEVTLMTPAGLRSIPCPTYPEIRLALRPGRHVREWLAHERPEALHIATEGPIGLAARNLAVRAGLRFTTSYHTQFPQYLRARYPVPESFWYLLLRAFHAPAARTMVGTRHVRRELRRNGLRHLVQWTRGVDTTAFRPQPGTRLPYPGPILIYVGRVAVEKSVEDFCLAKAPGTKLVVGGGPALDDLRARYPDVVFTGWKYGEELARLLAGADCFVFPSRTDTFGLVMLEAMACGLPVAAHPVTGPIDVVREGLTGCLREDLTQAIEGALRLDRGPCREQALEYRWENATRQFLDNLVELRAHAAAKRPRSLRIQAAVKGTRCP